MQPPTHNTMTRGLVESRASGRRHPNDLQADRSEERWDCSHELTIQFGDVGGQLLPLHHVWALLELFVFLFAQSPTIRTLFVPPPVVFHFAELLDLIVGKGEIYCAPVA